MTDAVIIIMYVAIVAALGATAFSLWRSTRSREQSWFKNGIALGVGALTVLTLLLTYVLGDGVADMFIATIAVLLVVAILTVCLSIVHTKYLR